MKRFWWIVREPVQIIAGVSMWLIFADLCGKKWGVVGVASYVAVQFLALFLLAMLLCAALWYQEKADSYDLINHRGKYAKKDRLEGK